MKSTVNILKKGQIEEFQVGSGVTGISTTKEGDTLTVSLTFEEGSTLSDSVLIDSNQDQYIDSIDFVDGFISIGYSNSTTPDIGISLDGRYLSSVEAEQLFTEHEALTTVIVIDDDKLGNKNIETITAYINSIGFTKAKGETIIFHIKDMNKVVQIVSLTEISGIIELTFIAGETSTVGIQSLTAPDFNTISLSFNI